MIPDKKLRAQGSRPGAQGKKKDMLVDAG